MQEGKYIWIKDNGVKKEGTGGGERGNGEELVGHWGLGHEGLFSFTKFIHSALFILTVELMAIMVCNARNICSRKGGKTFATCR